MRMGYSMPLSELSRTNPILPGGLAASPRLVRDERRGLLHVTFDATGPARAAYDALPRSMSRRRMAYDQGGGMDPRGAMSSNIVEFLRAKLSPDDFAELMEMAGGNGNGEDQGGPGLAKPEDLERRREGAEVYDRYGQDSAGMAAFVQAACARLKNADRP